MNNKRKSSAINISKINKKKYPDGYVYVLQFGRNNLFKFGVSNNPDRRISDIDSASPVPVIELGRFWFKNVYEIEEMIHDNIKQFLVRKEWFKMSLVDVNSIIEQLNTLSNDGIYLIKK